MKSLISFLTESGSIGANRILREQVRPTVEKYEKEVLQKFPGYKKCEITGSYNAGTKTDHGDIDLCVWIDSSEDIKNVKKAFKKHVEDLHDELTPKFKSGRNQGKKAQLYGSIVTCQIGIVGGKEGETVQIDNIIVLKHEELNFQKTFLNMNAQLQTLYTALVRVAPDNIKEEAFKHYRIAELPVLDTNQEFEFVLSSAGFSLRKVTLTDERKQKAKEEIWRSVNWDDVEWLIEKSLGENVQGKKYEEVLELTAKAYKNDERARKRICGVMKSMINIGPGEVGTLKGEAKEQGIKLAYKILNVSESFVSLKKQFFMKSLTQFLNESLNKKFGLIKKGDILYVADIVDGKVETNEIKVLSANLRSNLGGLTYVNVMLNGQISSRTDKKRIKLRAEHSTSIVNRNEKGTEYTIIAVSQEELEKEIKRLMN